MLAGQAPLVREPGLVGVFDGDGILAHLRAQVRRRQAGAVSRGSREVLREGEGVLVRHLRVSFFLLISLILRTTCMLWQLLATRFDA